jgi:hypothetical protein
MGWRAMQFQGYCALGGKVTGLWPSFRLAPDYRPVFSEERRSTNTAHRFSFRSKLTYLGSSADRETGVTRKPAETRGSNSKPWRLRVKLNCYRVATACPTLFLLSANNGRAADLISGRTPSQSLREWACCR